jgi:hypothetical protein
VGSSINASGKSTCIIGITSLGIEDCNADVFLNVILCFKGTSEGLDAKVEKNCKESSNSFLNSSPGGFVATGAFLVSNKFR